MSTLCASAVGLDPRWPCRAPRASCRRRGRGGASWADEPEIDLQTPFSGRAVLEAPPGAAAAPFQAGVSWGASPHVCRELLDEGGDWRLGAPQPTVPPRLCSPLPRPPGERANAQLQGHLPTPPASPLKGFLVGFARPRDHPSLPLTLDPLDVSSSCSQDSPGPWILGLGGSQGPEEVPSSPWSPETTPLVAVRQVTHFHHLTGPGRKRAQEEPSPVAWPPSAATEEAGPPQGGGRGPLLLRAHTARASRTCAADVCGVGTGTWGFLSGSWSDPRWTSGGPSRNDLPRPGYS